MKLKNFKSVKLHTLLTKMDKHIFHDGTVYTGSAGLAMYYFICAWSKSDVDDKNDLLKVFVNNINKPF